MAGNISFSFNVGINPIMNLAQLNAELDKLRAGISKARPIQLSSMVGKDISADNASQMFDTVKQQADMLDKVVIKTKVWKDEHGNLVNEIVGVNSKWSDSNGDIFESTRQMSEGLEGLDKSKLTYVGMDTATTNLKGSIDKLSKGYEDQGKHIQSAMDKAEKYSAVSGKWNKEQKEGMEKLNSVLKIQVNEWLELAKAGKGAEAGLKYAEIQKTEKAMGNLNAQTHIGSNVFQSWGSRIANAIKQTISYTLTLGSMRAAQQLLNKAIQFTIELNKEMVAIQVLQAEGAQTPEEITALASSYNDLAKEMGVTTLEIAKGSVEWLRQGKTIEETTELLRASTMLSKLGNIEAAQSTEFLTSAINGYGMAAEEAVGIVDKLVAVDNVAATSSAELATALRYSSAVASQAGVSLEELISYIGTISSTTRQNAEMIGQALKTIFTRMQDIKQGGLDEDGLGINNVERALRRVDVKLRDSQTEFRNMSDVLEDVAAKWETLNEVEQANIAKAVAGVRQQNMFMILMTEMNRALELQEVQYNSAGLAVDRYGIYLNGVEASQNKLKASLEGLFLSFGKMDDIIILVNNLASSVLDFISDAGTLRAILVAAGTALSFYITKTELATIVTSLFAKNGISRAITSLAIYIYSLTATSAATVAATGATITLSSAIKALLVTNPAGWVVLIIGALVALVSAIDTPIEKLKKMREEIESLQEEISGLRTKSSDLQSLSNEFYTLSQKLKGLSEEEKSATQEGKRLTEVQNELKKLMPGLIGYYNQWGDFIATDTSAIVEEKQAILDLIQAKKKLLEQRMLETASVTEKTLTEYKKRASSSYTPMGKEKTFEEIREDAKQYQDLLDETFSMFGQMGYNARKDFIAKFTEGTEFYNALVEIDEKMRHAEIGASIASRMTKEAENYLKNHPIEAARVEISNEGMLSFVQDIQSRLEKFSEVKEKMGEGDVLGISQDDLLSLGLEIENIGGAWQFTDESLKIFNDDLDNEIAAIRKTNPALADQMEALRNISSSAEELKYSLDDLISSQQMLSDAMDEFNSTGEISLSTALDLINAGYASALSFDNETGAITLNINALMDANIANAELAVARANSAVAAIDHATATAAEIAALEGTAAAALNALNAIKALGGLPATNFTYSGGGGGGGGGKSEAELAIEAEIEALEEQKEALKDRLDEFKKYIDAQKESLKLAKEEADFNKEMAEKSSDLAKLRTRIAVLALDDSEEARAKRLELEEEAAELEGEITEDVEDRKYDLQIEALDKMEEAFEDSINKQIDAINELIEALKDEAKEMSKAGGSGASGFGAQTTAIQVAKNNVLGLIGTLGNLNDKQILWLSSQIQRWKDLGIEIERIKALAKDFALNGFSHELAVKTWQAEHPGQPLPDYLKLGPLHTGGLVEEHHEGSFAGNLNSNEVFAKLLKGEYVATEVQMNNFMKSILPKIAMNMASPIAQEGGTENININIPITVQGSLDKSVVPDLKKAIFKEVNNAMKKRGVRRTAGSFSI